MLDTAIVGGGLCGLMLARGLKDQGRELAVYEARNRLGGRILSAPCAAAGRAVDLGPTWYWPDIQPRMTHLIEDLGLPSFSQHDDGTVLQLKAHDKPAETVVMDRLHGGARRLGGGMGALIGTLADQLPEETLHLAHELMAVHDRGDHVALLFQRGSEQFWIQARHVVLAIPPRLLAQHIHFSPALDPDLINGMSHTPTWMADQAKVVIGYETPFWRAAGHSGNAFVTHDHVTLREIFDACDANGQHAALGGFFALPAEFRQAVPASSLSMLVASQLTQVFGDAATRGDFLEEDRHDQWIQDWADERFTCSTADLSPPDGHPEYGDQRLRQRLWNGRLYLGGSETAGYGAGYLEGALDAAARIQRSLLESTPTQTGAANAISIAQFGTWVNEQRHQALEYYRHHLHRYLSGQQRAQLTQRALLDTVEQIYSGALDQLSTYPFDMSGIGIVHGRSDLTPSVLATFEGFNRTLIDTVVDFNRTSCALSNFGDEHEPEETYLAAISRDLAAAWREFALNVNRTLLAGRTRTEDALPAL